MYKHPILLLIQIYLMLVSCFKLCCFISCFLQHKKSQYHSFHKYMYIKRQKGIQYSLWSPTRRKDDSEIYLMHCLWLYRTKVGPEMTQIYSLCPHITEMSQRKWTQCMSDQKWIQGYRLTSQTRYGPKSVVPGPKREKVGS